MKYSSIGHSALSLSLYTNAKNSSTQSPICRSYYYSLLLHHTLPFQTLNHILTNFTLSPPISLSTIHNGHGSSLTKFIDPELPWRLAKDKSGFSETSIAFYPFRTRSTLTTMDRYQRVEKLRPETPINENEICITTQERMRNYIIYATTLFQFRASGIFLSQYCLVYARHGTRAPTKEKLKELNDLAMRMEVLLQDAQEQKLALQKSSCLVSGMEISLAREAQG